MSRMSLTSSTAATMVLTFACAWLFSTPAQAGPAERERAKRMHDRLVGVPPDGPTLDAMEAAILTTPPGPDGNDGLRAAADLALAHPAFYRVSLKNFVTPWTNQEQTPFAPLNDYTATVIGLIRDDVPFNEVLTADVVYTGINGVVPTPYSHTDNQHYLELEDQRVDLSDPQLFGPRTQSGLPGSQLIDSETAGVITTRAAGEAFFSAGTNRRMWRYLSMNFLCRDLEDMKDTTRPADRIRQDVSRSPGGDSQIYHNHCSGCHSGMDPLAGAFAYFEWDDTQERVIHTRGQVQPKYLINSNVFPGGYITVDNRWDNFWREGPNALLGWRAAESGGFGVKSLGAELAASRAFSVCQVEKVFEHVCFRPPDDMNDVNEVDRIATVFEGPQSDYNLKDAFKEVAIYCTAP